MDRPASQETIVERLAILDQQIESAQARLVKLQQGAGHPPLEDLEQTLHVLIASRSTLRAWLVAVERVEAIPRRPGRA